MRRNINRKSQGGLIKALNREFATLAKMNYFAAWIPRENLYVSGGLC
jgi:hypothetical protein